jgi:chemotaxis methyl-accepting protein methylase
LPGVRFEHMFVPDQWPDGVFELILLSEVVYYLSRDDVGRLAAKVINALPKGGSVILVHWTA